MFRFLYHYLTSSSTSFRSSMRFCTSHRLTKYVRTNINDCVLLPCFLCRHKIELSILRITILVPRVYTWSGKYNHTVKPVQEWDGGTTSCCTLETSVTTTLPIHSTTYISRVMSSVVHQFTSYLQSITTTTIVDNNLSRKVVSFNLHDICPNEDNWFVSNRS